jgi:NAD(P)-dependent dehydrogenase (short-subunit alcohol dehydrogenase family)
LQAHYFEPITGAGQRSGDLLCWTGSEGKTEMPNEMRFDDDVVIVTGAGRGLGREHALLFAARGAKVVVNDLGTTASGDGHELQPAQLVVNDIIAAGGKAIADYNNISTAAGATAVVKTAMDTFGAVTILVNNAGIITYETLDKMTILQWRKMLDVTLDGVFHMCKAVWPIFTSNRYGRIVNTTSNAGFAGNEQLIHYGAAKLGVAGFTKCLAQEAKTYGVNVNAIAPMAVTRMNQDAFFGGVAPDSKNWQADISNGIVPMGPPSIVSPTVLWLAHRSTKVNGEIYSTSSGKVGRVSFVVGEGYFNPNHGPEDLRDNIDAVRSLRAYLDPTCTLDELALIPPLFRKA